MLGYESYFGTEYGKLSDGPDPFLSETVGLMSYFLSKRHYFIMRNQLSYFCGDIYTATPAGFTRSDPESLQGTMNLNYTLTARNGEVGFANVYIDGDERTIALSILGAPGNATISVDFSDYTGICKVSLPNIMFGERGKLKTSKLGTFKEIRKSHHDISKDPITISILDVARSITALHKIPQYTA